MKHTLFAIVISSLIACGCGSGSSGKVFAGPPAPAWGVVGETFSANSKQLVWGLELTTASLPAQYSSIKSAAASLVPTSIAYSIRCRTADLVLVGFTDARGSSITTPIILQCPEAVVVPANPIPTELDLSSIRIDATATGAAGNLEFQLIIFR